ncbi:iron-containing alcohol dehydrogenase, partial [Pseudoalteromonas sp. 20-MNA-CIBAN-0454]|uniref:iron-containing alcohol dehydrogenase n=1 Tax=Pseudoalteromonas sp. 20-MNA-CIBAN-0454 TaxID=3140424 RepID=UPI00332CEE1F
MTVLEDGNDITARENMLLGSTLAGMAFVHASVAAVHGLSYPLGAKFHVPHGHSNALVMGPV